MTKRENLLSALTRKSPEYVPWGITLCESKEKEIREIFSCDDLDEFFDLPYRNVSLNPTKLKDQFKSYSQSIPAGSTIDEWGVAHVKGDVPTAHFSKMVGLMKDFDTVEQVKSFPLPDLLAEYRWNGFYERVNLVKQKGFAAMYSAVQIFETSWYMRGLDNFLMDMYDDNEIANEIIDRVTDIQCEVTRRITKAGIDIIVFGDDVGTQRSLMMSVDVWRNFIKPRWKKCIAAAKEINPNVLAYYHSDGNIESIIPELIEIGVDILNPVQPECMDPVQIKELYKDKLSFWGTIGTQTTMPFGTAKDVEDTVKLMIDTVGSGGGFVVAPTHIIEPEVPIENIMTFIKTAKEYGRYS